MLTKIKIASVANVSHWKHKAKSDEKKATTSVHKDQKILTESTNKVIVMGSAPRHLRMGYPDFTDPANFDYPNIPLEDSDSPEIPASPIK